MFVCVWPVRYNTGQVVVGPETHHSEVDGWLAVSDLLPVATGRDPLLQGRHHHHHVCGIARGQSCDYGYMVLWQLSLVEEVGDGV